jgi:hypothetical protein
LLIYNIKQDSQCLIPILYFFFPFFSPLWMSVSFIPKVTFFPLVFSYIPRKLIRHHLSMRIFFVVLSIFRAPYLYLYQCSWLLSDPNEGDTRSPINENIQTGLQLVSPRKMEVTVLCAENYLCRSIGYSHALRISYFTRPLLK